MARLLNALLLIFAIQITLVMFAGYTFPGGALWQLLINPADWKQLDLISFVTDALLIVGVGLIIVGTLLKEGDLAVFAGISTVFLSFGTSLYNLFQYIEGKALFGGSVGGYSWIAILFISPLVLIYVYLVLDYWRGKD